MLLQKLICNARSNKIFYRVLFYTNLQLLQKTTRKWMSTQLLITTPFTMAFWGFVKIKDVNETVVSTREILLARVDAMLDQEKYKAIYDILIDYKDSRDVEILWRLCRVLYNMSKSASEVEAKKMISEAYELICNALEIKEDHYAVHKWMSILLSSKSSYEGIRSKIKELFNIKKHMLRAIELNPTDATTLYMLGCWYFQVSDLTWYQRKIATFVLSEPPEASFEEALEYFKKAEEIDPNFYSHNLLMLGKTYLKLDQKEEAQKFLRMVAEFIARNDDDHEAKQEAQKLLKSI